MQKEGMMPGRCDRVLLGVYLMSDKHAATVDCQALRRNNAGTPKPPCLRCHVSGQPLCQRCKNVWDEETGAFLQFVVAWLCCDAVTMDGVSDSTACIAQGGLPLVLCVAPPVGEASRSLCHTCAHSIVQSYLTLNVECRSCSRGSENSAFPPAAATKATLST